MNWFDRMAAAIAADKAVATLEKFVGAMGRMTDTEKARALRDRAAELRYDEFDKEADEVEQLALRYMHR